MNKQPIETAKDADLRLSPAAMHRAAQRARELAMQTGTFIVVSHQGVIGRLDPSANAFQQAQAAQEPTAHYGKKP